MSVKISECRMPAGIFCGFFIYSLLVALLIQLAILPHFLPQIHLGHGLCIGDAMGIHEWATETSGRMRIYGWGAWDLYTHNQLMGGIASIFYYLIAPEPWSMLPYNAFLHASSGTLLYLVLRRLGFGSVAAAAGGTAFVMNPTSLEWVAQMQRDGMFILGNYIIFWGLTCGHESDWKKYFIKIITAGCLAAICFYLSRPYWYQILSALLIILLPLFILHLSVVKKIDAEFSFVRYFKIVVFIACCIFCLWGADQVLVQREIRAGNSRQAFRSVSEMPVQSSEIKIDIISEESLKKEPSPCQNEDNEKEGGSVEVADVSKAAKPAAHKDTTPLINKQPKKNISHSNNKQNTTCVEKDLAVGIYKEPVAIKISGREEDKEWCKKIARTVPFIFHKWEKTGFLPESIEQRMFVIWSTRGSPLLTPSGSKVDRDADLSSFLKIVAYIPRAIQVGWLSPFPELWIGEGSSAATTLGRPLVGALTLVGYFFLFCAAAFVFKNIKNVEVFSLVYLCVSAVALYAIVYPVVGTMIRFRYGFYMAGVAVGVAWAVEKILVFKERKAKVVR